MDTHIVNPAPRPYHFTRWTGGRYGARALELAPRKEDNAAMTFQMAKAHTLGLAAALLVAVAGACGSDGSGSTFDGQDAGAGGYSSSGGGIGDGSLNVGNGDATVPPQSLYFIPPSATVVVDGTGQKTAKFELVAVDANNVTTYVTAESVAFDRPDLATVTDAEPVVASAPSQTALYAGKGTIHAIYHGKEATATLTVQVHITDYGTGLDSTSPPVVALNGSILASDPGPAISPLLYPTTRPSGPSG